MNAVRTDPDEQAPHRGSAAADRPRTLAWTVVVGALLAVAAAYARVRWPGYLPLGSDNDEYQLVGQALAAFQPPVVAGVEGTKYPLGYPALLAVLEWLRLPVAPAALVLNLVAAGVATGLVAWTAGRPTATSPSNPGAALAAGAVVATSVAVWNDAFSVMPELVTLAAVAAMVALVGGDVGGAGGDRLDRRRLVWLSVLALVAVLLKTLTLPIVLGGATLLAVRASVRARRAGGRVAGPASSRGEREPGPVWHLLPAATATLAVLAGMLVMRPFPAHTTGYVETFLLRDPFDASQGSLGPLGLLRRTVADIPDTLADLGRAIVLTDARTGTAALIAVLGLCLGVIGAWRLRRGGSAGGGGSLREGGSLRGDGLLPRSGWLGPFAAGAVLAYVVALSSWPYHSSRFGLPMVPIAALGAGWVVRVLTDWLLRRDGGFAAGAALLVGAVLAAALVVSSYDVAVERGRSASAALASQHRALDTLDEWGDDALDAEDRLVSFDYREVARQLDRDVWPLAYTRDVEVLWHMVEDVDADVLVKVDFYNARGRQLALLLEAYPERFRQVLEGDGVGAWRVVPPAG